MTFGDCFRWMKKNAVPQVQEFESPSVRDEMMTRKQRSVAPLTLLMIVFVCSSGSAAEQINRKREKPVSGEVTGMTKTDVSVKVKSPKEDTLKIASNDITSIAWGGEPPECNVARKDEEGGRYQKAIDGYQKALASGKATNPLLKSDLEFGIARASAKQALADPAKIDEAVKKLEEFRSKQADHYRFYEGVNFLGQLYAAKKDFIKAKLAFDTLGKSPWKDYQMAAKVALGRMALADNKPDEALAEYDAVVAMQAEGPVEESQRQEAVLGKARILIIQKKYDDALKLLDEVIAKAPADDAKVNAEAFLRQGDCLREQGADKDALLAYLHVDVLFSSEKAMHAEALYRLASLWDKVGSKVRADEARERLKSDYENTEWARQLKAPTATKTD
jgi:tetratricopeptide (TPR) repeat protein